MRLLFTLISPEQLFILPCQIVGELSLVFSKDVTFKKNHPDL